MGCSDSTPIDSHINQCNQTVTVNPHDFPLAKDYPQTDLGMGNNIINIAPRLQWDNDGGYCGQTAVQSAGLHLGHYCSALKVRKAAGSEFLIGQNAAQALDKLGFHYDEWDINQKQPQHTSFLKWMKNHILKGHPVIFGAYSKGGKMEAYDHIMVAVGVESNAEKEILIYCDFYQEDYLKTHFEEIWDTREMQGNAKQLEWAIPRDINYGIAVIGRKDWNENEPMIEIMLSEKKEPNVSIGEEAIEFELEISVSNLLPDESYDLLTTKDGQEKKVRQFKSDEEGNAKIDYRINSDAFAVFRCVKSE